VGLAAAAGLMAFVVLERERLSDVVPRTLAGWLRVGPLVLGLAVLLLVVLPRLVRRAGLRLAVAAVVLGVTAWFTIVPAFFDTRVEERLLGAPAAAPAAGPTTNSPTGPTRLSTGRLQGRGGHSASGAASVYRLPNGSAFVRLDDIDTPHAPAVYVYLAPRPGQQNPTGAVELGELKGNQGSQNYVLPEGIDPAGYPTVLLWCRRFSTPIANAAQA
jgi:hypothetical protein